jgi:hypothetical protein
VAAEELQLAAQHDAACKEMLWQSVHGLLDFVDKTVAPGLNRPLAEELDKADPITQGVGKPVPISRIVSHDNWKAFLDDKVKAIQEDDAVPMPGEYASESVSLRDNTVAQKASTVLSSYSSILLLNVIMFL